MSSRIYESPEMEVSSQTQDTSPLTYSNEITNDNSSYNNPIMEIAKDIKSLKDDNEKQFQELATKIQLLQDYIKGLTIASSPTRNETAPQQNPSPKQKEAKSEISETKVSVVSKDKLLSDAQKPEEVSDKPYSEMQSNYTSDDVKIEDVFYCGKKTF